MSDQVRATVDAMLSEVKKDAGWGDHTTAIIKACGTFFQETSPAAYKFQTTMQSLSQAGLSNGQIKALELFLGIAQDIGDMEDYIDDFHNTMSDDEFARTSPQAQGKSRMELAKMAKYPELYK